MSIHRPRRPYSTAYARRQLSRVEQALESVRALKVTEWRKVASKAEALRQLEAEERKWRRVLEPGPLERFYQLPF